MFTRVYHPMNRYHFDFIFEVIVNSSPWAGIIVIILRPNCVQLRPDWWHSYFDDRLQSNLSPSARRVIHFHKNNQSRKYHCRCLCLCAGDGWWAMDTLHRIHRSIQCQHFPFQAERWRWQRIDFIDKTEFGTPNAYSGWISNAIQRLQVFLLSPFDWYRTEHAMQLKAKSLSNHCDQKWNWMELKA